MAAIAEIGTEQHVVEQLVEAGVLKPTNMQSLDGYGRDASERTVELDQHVAQAVNDIVDEKISPAVLGSLKAEFEGGKCKTYDEALGYIVYRGICEIKRQWDAADAAKEKSTVNTERKLMKEMLKLNPALATDPNFVGKMLALINK